MAKSGEPNSEEPDPIESPQDDNKSGGSKSEMPPLSSFGSGQSAGVGEAASYRIADQIGPYRIVREIGEGGMGSVYEAQQLEPVKRAVAIKVIRAGRDSKTVIARFEAERQALAMMDHPAIARIVDAGTTELGQPFFAMELGRRCPVDDLLRQPFFEHY